MDDYKDPIRNFFDARTNLCKELEEGPVKLAGNDAAIFWYLMSAAWWGVDRYQRKVPGEVPVEEGSPKAIARVTGISKSTVYLSVHRLYDAGWIDGEDLSPGRSKVTVLLDEKARQHRRTLSGEEAPLAGSGIGGSLHLPDPESDSRSCNSIPASGKWRPRLGMTTATDLRK